MPRGKRPASSTERELDEPSKKKKSFVATKGPKKKKAVAKNLKQVSTAKFVKNQKNTKTAVKNKKKETSVQVGHNKTTTKVTKVNNQTKSAKGKKGPAAETKLPTKKPESSSPGSVKPRLPPKFSWIVEGLLAGHGRPTLPGHLQFLQDQGVTYIITLTLNKPRALQGDLGKLRWVHIPIQDEKPPTVEQMKQFAAAVDKAKAESTRISAHCAWGRGRTGTMCASYLVHTQGLTAQQAIAEIRQMRPGSIDTDQQAQAVNQFADYCRKK